MTNRSMPAGRTARTEHVSMPWKYRIWWIVLSIASFGVLIPLWAKMEKQYRREHTITVYQ